MAEDEETATAAPHRQQCIHAIDAENDVRDHRHDGGRSGRISLDMRTKLLQIADTVATGPDGRGARASLKDGMRNFRC